MTRPLRNFIYGFFLASLYLLPYSSFGQAMVTPATTAGGVSICEKGGSVGLNPIKITETADDDIGGDGSDHTAVTLVLAAPAGFHFVNGAGLASALAGGDLTNVSITGWTTTTVTITLDALNTTVAASLDELTISGLQLLAVSGVPQSSVKVTFDGSSTVAITGIPTSTVLATLSSTVNTTLTVSVDNSIVCPNQSVNLTIASSESGINYQIFDTANNALSSSTPGNGGNLIIPTSIISSTPISKTLKVVATDGTAGCSTELQQQQTITVVAPPTVFAGGSSEACHTAGTYQIISATSSNGTIVWTHNGLGTLDSNSIISPTYTFNSGDAGNVVTFTLTVTGSGSCGSVADTFSLSITIPPQANAGSDEAICFGTTFNFNAQSTPATATNYASVSWATNGTGTLNNANTLTPNYIPAINESGIRTFTLTSSGTGSCANVQDQMQLNIQSNPAFTVSNTTAVPFCSGGTAAITLNSSTSGAVVELVSVTTSDPGVTGYTSAGTTYNSFPVTISDVITNATTSLQTLVYEFEVSVAGCVNPVHKSTTVTVRPIPNLTVTNNIASPICSGGATNIDLTDPTSGVVITVTGVSVSPTPGGVTGYSAVNSTFANGSKVTNVLVNNTNVQQTVTYSFRSSANGCTDPTLETATVIVQPSPVFTLTNSASSICSGGNTNLQLGSTSSGAAIELVTVTPSDPGLTGFTTAGTIYNSFPTTITDNLVNSTTSVQTVVYEFEVRVAGCVNPVHKTATVTVRPIPNLTVTNNIASPICSGSSTNIDLADPTSGVVIRIVSVSISPTPGGVTGYSAVNSTFADGSKVTNVLVNNTGVQQTVTYTFRSTANGCTDPVDETATVVVLPSPLFSVTNSASAICSGTSTTIQLSGVSSGASVHLISVTPSNAGVTGFTGAGATYSSFPVTISDNLVNPTASAQTVIYEFSVTIGGGCSNPVHKIASVTINPIPSLSITNNASTIASGKNTNIDLFDTTNGVVITLETVTTSDPSISGYSAVGSTFANGSKVTDVLVNSTSNPQTITYGFRSSANGCTDTNLVNVTVTINPGGVFAVTNGAPQICSGALTSLTINSPTAGATVELVNVTPSNAGVTGFTPVNTTYTVFPHVINDALLNPTNSPQTVQYEFEISVGGVPNPTHEFATVIVNPIPSLTITNNTSSICSSIQTDITFTSPTSGALITLTSVTPGGVTGNTLAGTTFANGSKLRDVLVNTTGSSVVVTYNFDISANGCSVSGFSTTVTVAPSPDFTVTNNVTSLCSSGNQNIDLITPVTGAKITVTGVTIGPAASGVTGVIPLNTQYTSFPGTQTITGSLVNTTNAVQTVTYEFEMSVGSCVNPVRQAVSIAVSPTPSMSITNAATSVCSGGATGIVLNSPTAGAIITLTNVAYGGATGNLSNTTTYTPGSIINDVLHNSTSAPVAVNYTFEVSANGCTVGGYTTSVTVSPTLDFTVINNTPSFCSGNNQNIDLTTSVSGATITVTGVTTSPTAGTITGVLTAGTPYTSFPGTQTLSGTLTNTSNSVQTVTYEFEMSSGSCVNPTRQTVSIVVYPSPSMSITNTSTSICSEGYTNITLNSPTNGAIITLASVVYGGVTGNLSNNTTYTPGTVISELLQNTTSSPVTVSYTFEVSANGCTITGFTTNVVVNPNPDFTVANGNPTICDGGQTNISFSSATAGHQINVASVNYGGVTGGTVVAGSTIFTNGNTLAETLTNHTNAAIDVVYTFNVTTPGTTPACPVAIVNKQVVVRVQPQLLFTYTNAAPAICSGSQANITLLTSVTGSQLRLSAINYNGVSGSLSTGMVYSNNQKINETLVNTTTAPITVSYTIEEIAGACTSAPQVIQVIVNPIPKLSSPLSPSAICSNSTFNYTATSATSGANFNWSRAVVSGISQSAATGSGDVSETLTNTTSLPINVTYVYVVDANGCNNNPGQSVVVTVNPGPLLSSTLTPSSICSGATFNYTATSATSGASFSWSRGVVAGISQSAGSGIGNVSEVLNNISGSPVNVTYVYLVSANGCSNAPGQSVVVTVQPVPSVVDPADQVICHGVNTTLVDFTSTGVGTSYSWVNDTPGIGLPASGTGNIASFSAINTGSSAVTATITVTPHYSACTGTSQSFTITVNPSPVVNTIANQVVCNNFSATAITFAGVATSYDWTNNNTSIGLAASGTNVSGIPAFTTTNTGNTVQVSTIVVTPKFVSGAVTCIGATRSFTITVNPIPDVAASNQSICSGQTSNVLISNPNGVSGTTFSWAIGTVTGTITGYSAASGTAISQVLTSAAGGSVEYIITPSANGCAGSAISKTVTVDPVPVGNSVAAGIHVICSGTALNITPTSNVGSATYTWSGSNGSGGSGAITDAPVNATTAPVNVTYTVVPNGPSPTLCTGSSFTIVVTVNPNPTFTINNTSAVICSGVAPSISVSSPTSGAVITLQNVNYGALTNGTYIAGGSFGTGGSLAEGNLVNTTSNPIVVTYTFNITTSTSPSCPTSPTTQTTTVTVQPAPSFTVNNITPSICSNSKTDIILNTPVTGGQIRLKSVIYGAVSGTLSAGAIYTNGQKIAEVLSNTTNAPVTVQYEFEALSGSCGPGASTITAVTVNPNPSFTITNATSSICSGTSPSISVSSPTTGAVITLQSVSYGSVTNGVYTAGGSFGTGGSLAEGNLVNVTNNPIVVIYTFTVSTPTSPSCPLSISSQSTAVIVQPAPSFTLNNITSSICSGSKTDITLNTLVTGGQIRLKTITYGAVSGTLSAGAVFNNGQKITETLLNTTNAPVTVQYEFESVVGSCGPGAPTITTVIVNPNPTFTISNSTSTICSGSTPSITVSSPTTGAVIALQNVNYGVLTNGAYASGGSFGTGGTLVEGNLTNNTNNPIVVTYTFSVTTPTSPSCPLSVTTQSTTVTVQPAPSFTLNNITSSICSGSKTDITLNTPVTGGQIRLKTITYGAVSGTLSAGAVFNNGQKITETLLNTTNAPVTVQYEFESLVGSCGPGATTTTTVTVNPNPTFTISNSTSVICSGATPSITVSSPTSGGVIALQNVNYGSLANGAYVSGGSFGTGGTLVEGNLTNNTNNPIVVTYTFSVTTPTSPSCPLSVTTQSTTVTVQPAPSFTLNNITLNICSGSKTDITLNTPVTGGQIRLKTITYGAVSGTLSAGAVFNNGQKITETLLNNTNAPITVQYQFEAIVGSCGPGVTTSTSVTVNPNPTFIVSNSTSVICSGVTPSITVSSPTTGAVIALQNVNYGALTNGAYASGGSFGTSGTLVEGSLTNNTNNPIVVTYIFSVSTPTSPSCPLSVTTQSTTVTVQPRPSFTLNNITASICSGSKTDITLNTPVSGGQIRLSSVNYGAVTGSLTAGAIYVNGQKILETLTNSTNSPITVQYQFESMVGSCGPSAITTTSVTVNPNPTFTITNTTAAICSGTSPSISVSSPTTGAVIVLQNVNYGALTNGAYASGGSFGMGGSLVEGNLTNTTSNSITVTYTFRVTTPTTPSCPLIVTTQTTTVKVDPIPTVVFFGLPSGSPPQKAENDPAFTLSGNQKGGLFTISPGLGLGSTVQNPTDEATFNPSAATIYDGHPSTINTITYTYTNETGCTNSSSQNIIINAITDIDFGVEGSVLDNSGYYNVCAEQGQVKLLGFPSFPDEGKASNFESLTAGLTIKFDGIDYFIETTGLVANTYGIKYTFTNSANATSTKIRSIKVLASPVAKFISSNNCIVSDVVFTDQSTIDTTFGATITGWQWNFGDGDLSSAKNPSKRYTQSNTYYVTLKVTTNEGCSNTTPATAHPLRVGPVPKVNYEWSAICTNDFTNFDDKTTNVGISQITSYNWDFGDGDILTAGLGDVPAGTNNNRTLGTYQKPRHNYQVNGVYNAVLTVNTNDGCSSTKLKKVSILLGGAPVRPDLTTSYTADFEASGAGWIAEAQPDTANTSWIWGTPSGLTIKTAASGSKVWWTGDNRVKNNADTYYKSEHSVVNGPCFDLTELDRPMVSMDYWSDSEKDVDGAVLQYSVDGGLNWIIVGPAPGLPDRDQGIDWFNSSAITSNPGYQPVGPYGWSNRLGKWINGRFNLDMIPTTSRSQVRLRIAFASNDSNPTADNLTFDGFAFDNFYVGEKQRNVLIEHFTDSKLPASVAGDTYLDNLYNTQFTLHNLSDYNDIRYHITSTATPDPLNQDNQADPGARATYMGVSNPPTTIMDGIVNTKFTGKFAEVTAIELDRRALKDPLFDLNLTVVPTASTSTIKVNLDIKAKAAHTDPLIVQVVLMENSVGTFKNVLRKALFGPDGQTVSSAFVAGQSMILTNSNEEINVPIVNSDQLSLVAYVQNKNTREIYQSLKIAAPAKTGRVIVGLEEEVISTTLNGITIYPNPANQVFSFGIPDQNTTQGYSWKLADQRGVVVKSGDFENAVKGQKQVDVSGLPNAVYFVIITGPGRSVVYRKLVIVNSN